MWEEVKPTRIPSHGKSPWSTLILTGLYYTKKERPSFFLDRSKKLSGGRWEISKLLQKSSIFLICSNKTQHWYLIRSYDRISYSVRCGGTILCGRFIMTAAHCVDGGTQPGSIQIMAGEHDLLDNMDSATRHNVKAINNHPGWG